MPIRYLSGVNVDSNTLVVDAANDRVGIGTASPATALEINQVAPIITIQSSDTNQFHGIEFRNGGNLDAFIKQLPQTGEFKISNGRSVGWGGHITLYTDTVERLRITAAGNVGIGTTSPSYKLDVSGTARTTESTYLNTASGNVIVGGTSSDVTASFKFISIGNSAFQYGPSTGNYLRIEPGNADTVLSIKADARSGAYPPLAFFTSDAERLRILANGNVGIGTTAPTARLEIAQTGGPQLRIVSGDAFGSADVIIDLVSANDFRGRGIFYRNSTDSNQWFSGVPYTGGSYSIGYHTSQPEYLANSKFFINTSGNVGIGTTSPTTALHVVGLTQIVESGNTAFYGGNYVRVFNDQNFNIRNVSGTTIANISVNGASYFNGGNVGIGTTSPSNKLEVVGGVTIGTPASSTVNLYLTRTNSGVVADANYFVSANNTPNQTWIEGGYYNGELSGVVTAPNSGYPYIETYSGQGGSTTKSFGFINKTSGSFTSADVFITMSLLRTGRVTFNKYGVGTFTGTATQRLAVDASGNVIEIPIGSGPVDGNGTANYVTKWSDADTITNSQIFDNGTNVGIGTTNPGQKLQIGDGTATGSQYFRIFNSASDIYIGQSGGSIFGFSANSAGLVLSDNGSFPFGIGTVSAQPFVIGTNNAERMRITSAGNVGIGTTAPAYKLDVVGAANSSTATTSGTGTLNLGTTAQPTIAGQITGTQSPSYSSTGKLGFSVTTWGVGSDYGLTEVMAIDMRGADSKAPTIWMNPFGGNVGIGTTSPTAKLEVNVGLNSLKISGRDTYVDSTEDATNANIYVTQAGVGDFGQLAGNLVLQARTQGTVYRDIIFAGGLSNGDALMTILGEGNVGIGTTAPQDKLTVKGATNYNLNLGLLGGYSGIYVYNDASSAYNHLRIDASPLLLNSYSGANVGIGTSSPLYGLNIKKTNTPALFLETPNGAGNETGLLMGSSFETNYIKTGIFYKQTDASYYIGDIHFALNSAQNSTNVSTSDTKMIIKSGGNVGIGTTAPVGKLHIAATTGVASPGSIALSIRDAGSSTFGFDFNLEGVTTGDLSLMRTVSGVQSQVMTFDRANGNVGIGTTAPYEKLEVAGAISATGAVVGLSAQGHSTTLAVSSGVSYLYAVDWGAEFKPLSVQGKTISLETGTGSTSARVTIDNSGNVGIGTTSPSVKLDVNGIANASGGIVANSENFEKYLGVKSFADAVANRAINVQFGNFALGGRFEITIAGTFSNANAGGGITKVFSVLTNPSNNIYTNESRVTTAVGPIVNNFAIGEFQWDSGSSQYIIPISHIVSSGNPVYVHIKVFGMGNTANVYNNVSLSDPYTLTALSTTYEYYNNNLGIGTTSPGELLEVVGNIRANVSNGGGFMLTGASASGLVRAGATGLALRTDTTDRLTIDNSGAATFSSSVTASSLIKSGGTASQYLMADGSVSTLTNPVTGTGTTNYVPKWTSGSAIGNSNIYDNAGNIGIGTTAPNGRLQINQGTDLNVAINTVTNDATTVSRISSLNDAASASTPLVINANRLVFTTDTVERLRITSDGQVLIGTTTAQSGTKLQVAGTFDVWSSTNTLLRSRHDGTIGIIQAYTGGAVATIALNTEGGNVGIGTTSPVTKLQVAGGSISIDADQPIRKAGDNSIIGYSSALPGINIGSGAATDMVAINAGGTERVRINTSGNVGIGTTSPASKLHISNATGNVTSEIQSVASGANAILKLTSPSNNWQIINDGTSANLDFQRGGSSVVYFKSDGNVGIGTTAPLNLLHVSQAAANTIFRLGNNASYDQFIYFNGGNDWSLGMDYSNSNAFVLSNSSSIGTNDRIVVTTGGNVGIGTTAPASLLHVAGGNIMISNTVAAAAPVGGIVFKQTNSTGFDIAQIQGIAGATVVEGIITMSTKDSGGTMYERLRITSGGNFEIPWTNNLVNIMNYDNDYRMGLYYQANSRIFTLFSTGGDGGGSITFNTRGTAATGGATDYGSERMRITAAGNVGIGTTSPGTALDVEGGATAGATVDIKHTNANGYSGIDFYENTGTHVGSLWHANSSAVASNQNAMTLAARNSGDKVYIVAGGYDPSTSGGITVHAGNVGIGTTSPTVALDVNGTINGGFLTISRAETTAVFTDTRTNIHTTTPSFIVQNTGDTSVTTLYHRLVDLDYAGDADTVTGTYVRFLTGGTERAGLGLTSDKFTITTGVTERLTIDASGNVGIGTTAPSSILHLYKTSYPVLTLGSGVVTGNMGIDTANNFMSIGTETNHGLSFATNNTAQMRLTPAGNLGIGTTAPDEKLHVDGSTLITYNNSFQSTNSVGNKAILARVSPTSGIINYAEYATATNLNGFVIGSDDARVKGNITGDSLEFITNTSTRMTILSGGNVGINTTTPGSTLHVVGDVLIQTGALGVGVNPNATDGRIDASNDIVAFSTSDKRLKENITPIANALEKVRSLTGVEFDWKEETKSVHGYEGHDVGVIAQDVQAVLPEAVRTNDTGYLSVRYEKMIALLIEANKELANRVEQLEKLIK